MKCLTLTQPWASLVAVGAKTIETRSWRIHYRGPLAIHAAKGFPRDARDMVSSRLVRTILSPHFGGSEAGPLDKQLPLGAVIATCRLIDCLPMEYCGDCDGCGWYEGGKGTIKTECNHCGGGGCVPAGMPLTKQESAFGNYEPGRWAWILDRIQPLDKPVPAKGELGLWQWEGM